MFLWYIRCESFISHGNALFLHLIYLPPTLQKNTWFMNDLLVADAVSKNFGHFKALNSVSIAVPKGSIFGLLGPNGAGKTTFCNS